VSKPRGLKARPVYWLWAARLKPCPSQQMLGARGDAAKEYARQRYEQYAQERQSTKKKPRVA